MKILLLPEQLLAMFQEELDEMKHEGEFLQFSGLHTMYRRLWSALKNAVINSKAKVVE